MDVSRDGMVIFSIPVDEFVRMVAEAVRNEVSAELKASTPAASEYEFPAAGWVKRREAYEFLGIGQTKFNQLIAAGVINPAEYPTYDSQARWRAEHIRDVKNNKSAIRTYRGGDRTQRKPNE